MSKQRIRFLLLALLALVVSSIPLIHYPFGWIETFFHELSHGIAALVSGGSIHSIKLNLDGSGVCMTSGGNEFLILFSGYAGSGLWGTLIYFSASILDAKNSKAISLIISVLISLVAVLWVKDVVTLIILGCIIALFIVSNRYSSNKLTQLLISFIALYVVLNALRSPLNLLDGRNIGDGFALSELTMLPELFWVVCWCGISFCCLYLLFKKNPKFS